MRHCLGYFGCVPLGDGRTIYVIFVVGRRPGFADLHSFGIGVSWLGLAGLVSVGIFIDWYCF